MQIKQVVYIIMGLVYTFLGVFIYLNKWFLTDLNSTSSIALGIIFVLYGLFRVYRAVKALIDERN